MQLYLHSYAFIACTRRALPLALPFCGWWRPKHPSDRSMPVPLANTPSNFFYSCADLLLLWAEKCYTTWRLRGTLKVLFVIQIIRIFTMKFEKLHLHGNNSMCAGTFQLLRERARAQLRGNIATDLGPQPNVRSILILSPSMFLKWFPPKVLLISHIRVIRPARGFNTPARGREEPE
jgi:hypothetical protein